MFVPVLPRMFLVQTVILLIYHHNITINRRSATNHDVPKYVVFLNFVLLIFSKLKIFFPALYIYASTVYGERERTNACTHKTGIGVVLCVSVMYLDKKEEYGKL
jgi:hypothetical protein